MQKKDLKNRFDVLKKGGIPLPENLTDETLLTRGEAATYARCSVRTLITWIDERGLREVKQGRYSRIRKRELDRFLDGENDESREDGALRSQKKPVISGSVKRWRNCGRRKNQRNRMLIMRHILKYRKKYGKQKADIGNDMPRHETFGDESP